ncbi:winged helix-turn-helix transcriptional regulator [Bacillus tuaregi]|uniref:winged helix-turn-helix transcriptional regulator n=1 Tax=Bacillus tuaregi TaxID=1816695 RepID=UPI0008F8D44A|nr:helix-turn-helix domain-containing protein [Bacillus tuaregi]
MEANTICPKFHKAVEILSKRWNALIINQLMSGSQRFCTINSSMPISGRLLSERLKELENEGIVSREVFPEVPVRVEYTLTEKGLALQNVFKEINQWASVWVRTAEDRKEDEM